MLRHSLKMCLWMIVVTGIVYPLLVTLIAQLTMPYKANGSLIVVKDQVVGSHLIGQRFDSDQYFWGRPSAVGYDAASSGGSNLGPISLQLKNQVSERKQHLLDKHPGKQVSEVPSDLLFASGSGLDPHITLEAANFQKGRIAKARNFDDASIQKLTRLIEQLTVKKTFGFLGVPCLNVLELNLALDELGKKS